LDSNSLQLTDTRSYCSGGTPLSSLFLSESRPAAALAAACARDACERHVASAVFARRLLARRMRPLPMHEQLQPLPQRISTGAAAVALPKQPGVTPSASVTPALAPSAWQPQTPQRLRPGPLPRIASPVHVHMPNIMGNLSNAVNAGDGGSTGSSSVVTLAAETARAADSQSSDGQHSSLPLPDDSAPSTTLRASQVRPGACENSSDENNNSNSNGRRNSHADANAGGLRLESSMMASTREILQTALEEAAALAEASAAVTSTASAPAASVLSQQQQQQQQQQPLWQVRSAGAQHRVASPPPPPPLPGRRGPAAPPLYIRMQHRFEAQEQLRLKQGGKQPLDEALLQVAAARALLLWASDSGSALAPCPTTTEAWGASWCRCREKTSTEEGGTTRCSSSRGVT